MKRRGLHDLQWSRVQVRTQDEERGSIEATSLFHDCSPRIHREVIVAEREGNINTSFSCAGP